MSLQRAKTGLSDCSEPRGLTAARGKKKVMEAQDSGIFSWLVKTPAGRGSKKVQTGVQHLKKKTPNLKNLKKALQFEGEENLLSAPKKKIQPVKAVTGSKFVKNQPKIDNMYKRVPLKRPSFKLEGEKSDSVQPSKPVWDQVAGAAAILE